MPVITAQRLEMYRRMAHNFPNGALYVVDRDLRYIIADGMGMRQVGLTREMLEGKLLSECFPPDTVAMAEPLFRAALEGRTETNEVTFLAGLYQTYSVPITNDQGVVEAALLMVQDIGPQREMEATLTRQNRLLSDLHKITIDVLNRHNLDEILQYLADSAAAVMEAPYTEIMLKQGDALVVVAVTDPVTMMLGDAPDRNEARLSWQAYDLCQPVVLDDYQQWPHRRAVYDDIPFHATADLPITVNGHCVGVLSLARAVPDTPFTPQHVEMGMMLAQTAGLLFDNANLYASALRELEERTRVEAALRTSELRYRTVVDVLVEGVVVHDEEGRVVTCNPAAARILGLTQAELFRRAALDPNWWMTNEAGDKLTVGKQGDSPIAIALRTGQPQNNVTLRVHKSDGSETWISISAQPMFRPGESRPSGAVASFFDITERRAAEQQALQLAAEIKRAEVIRQFIQDASHEFRTPLSIIQTSLYLLYRAAEQEQKDKRFEQVSEQIVRISRLLDHLVMQAVLDSEPPLQLKPVNVNALLEECAIKTERRLKDGNLTLELTLEADLPPVGANSDRLFYAFEEIVDNAIRYTPSGGKITIISRREDENVIVEISDTGIGIAPADLQRIFERFYRRDTAHTTPGFGLGLSIVDKIIERHRGTIQVESALGKSTTFRIVLPPISIWDKIEIH
jgi:PAS domain S-box-containing protein